jgi:hypothetical protein
MTSSLAPDHRKFFPDPLAERSNARAKLAFGAGKNDLPGMHEIIASLAYLHRTEEA